MKLTRISKALVGVAVLALTSAVAFADVVDKKTILTTQETIEVPGAILPPGEYVLKVVQLPSYAKKHVVQITNKEETEVLSTVIAIPNSRSQSGETEFEWHETPAGQPPALKAWFYPTDNYGQEFAYPESRATELSAATNQEVAHVSDQEAESVANQQQNDIQPQRETVAAQTTTPRTQSDNSAAERLAAQQSREREAAAQQSREREAAAQQSREREAAAQQSREREAAAQQTRDREIAAQRERDMQTQRDRERQQLAQASQNQQRTADRNLAAQPAPQSQPTNRELPETAGFGILLALIGLGSLGASRAVRKLRK